MSRLKYKHGKITVQPYNWLEVELNSHMRLNVGICISFCAANMNEHIIKIR